MPQYKRRSTPAKRASYRATQSASRTAASALMSLSRARVFSIAAPQQSQPGPRRRYQKPEVKFTDTNMTTAWDASNAATNVLVINQVAVGTAVNQRIGNVICNKSLELTGAVYGGILQTTIPQAVRIMIYWDKQPDPAGVVTTIAPSLLLNAQTSGLANIQNTDRYVIIYDKIFTIGSNQNIVSTGFNTARAFHIYLDLKGVETRFITAGGATFPSTNSLCLATMGDTAGGGPNTTPVWSGFAQTRVRFTDS